MTTRTTFRSLAVIGAVSMALAACGGGDDDAPVAAPDSEDVVTLDTRPSVDGPEATIPPDLPGSYDGGVGPVDIIGTPLPPNLDQANDIAIGLPAPVLVGLDAEGRAIRIDPTVDGPTMLVFLAHWCPSCNNEVPQLVRMRSYGQFPEGLNIIGVLTAASPDRPNWPPTEWIRDDMNWRYPTLLDGINPDTGASLVGTAYGVTGYPTTVLIDGDGMVAGRWSGEREPEQILANLSVLGLS